MRQNYDCRRRLFLIGLKRLNLPVRLESDGAFYILVDSRHLYTDSYVLMFNMLEKAGVAIDPGIDFGSGIEGYLRFSYANLEANIIRSLSLVGKIVSRLRLIFQSGVIFCLTLTLLRVKKDALHECAL